MIDMFDPSALAAGDSGAWRRFLSPATAIAQTAIRRVLAAAGKADETGDVVQDFFLRLLKDDCRLLRRFDPSRAKIATYLAMVAATTAVDHLRKKVPQPIGSAQELETWLPSTPPPSPTGERLDIPSGVLTPRQALILQLTIGKDMSPQEAGALLGISEQTVRSMRHKALTRLRELETENRSEQDGTEKG